MGEASWVLRVETDVGGVDLVVTEREAHEHGPPDEHVLDLLPHLFRIYRQATGRPVDPAAGFVIRCGPSDRFPNLSSRS